jgi:hypothetical protein
MSQRELIDELRLLLDLVCDAPCEHVRCAQHRAALIILREENPTSMFSVKVTHNIGKSRHARLLRAVEGPASASREASRGALAK